MDSLPRLSAPDLNKVWGLAFSLTRNAADADDVMQQAFVVAWQKRARLPEHFLPWFSAVVANCARNHQRKEAKHRSMADISESAALSPLEGPDSAAIRSESTRQLHAALSELDENMREAVALCFIAGLTELEGSQATGTNLNTFKSRVQRGRDQLRQRLKSSDPALGWSLATVAFPQPLGGMAGAIERWEKVALAAPASVPGALWGPAKFAGVFSVVLLVALGAWLVLERSISALPANPAIAMTGDSRSEPAGLPAANLDSKAGEDAPAKPEDANSGASRGRGSEGTPEGSSAAQPEQPGEPGKSDETDRRQPPGSGGRLITKSARFNSGELWMQWSELISDQGAAMQGTYTRYFRNGVAEEVGQYENDLREGFWLRRHENGEIQSRGEFRKGKRQGLWTYSYPNAQKRWEGSFLNDLEEGQFHRWHENGIFDHVVTFEKGLREGKVTYADETGRKVREATWFHGKKHGLEVDFDALGNPVNPRSYEQGKPIE